MNNQVDIGVRVELPAEVFEHITDVVYESKLVYRTKGYGDQVRTFCMNPYGHVVAETWRASTRSTATPTPTPLRSENTNFALLVSNRFTQPFNEPYRYGSLQPGGGPATRRASCPGPCPGGSAASTPPWWT